MHFGHAFFSESYLGGEVWHIWHRIGHNICALHNALTSCKACEHGTAKARPGVGHGQCGAALAILGIYNFSTCVLHALVQVCNLLGRNLLASLVLGEERQDGGTSVSADDGNVDLVDGNPCDLMHELVCAHNIQGRDTADLFGVQALLLVQLAHGWHHGVHRVHNQAKYCVGTILATCLHNALGNTCIDAKEICASHAWLSRQTCRNKHKIATSQTLFQFVNWLVLLGKRVVLYLGGLFNV
mmetsp:Transcript_132194/g.240464  ORF Transcript_132194/g.240464 Transcript_132194/m.240464 type:complete len:241 (+) Transcript_132194:298-1020(+)